MSIFNMPRLRGKSTYIANQAIHLLEEHYKHKSKPPLIIVPRMRDVGSMRLLLDSINREISQDIIIEDSGAILRRPFYFESKLLLMDEAQACLEVIASSVSAGLAEATMTVENRGDILVDLEKVELLREVLKFLKLFENKETGIKSLEILLEQEPEVENVIRAIRERNAESESNNTKNRINF